MAKQEPEPAAGADEGAFLWPPRKPEAVETQAPPAFEAPPAPTAGTPVLTPRGGRALWRAVERCWLAPVAPPLAERIELTGWAPDPFGVFCDRCGGPVGPHEADEFGCAACLTTTVPWARFVRLGPHVDPLRAWVHEVKFTRWRRLGVDLGRLLGERIRLAGAPRERVCVVPMPTTFRRRMSRGVDHAGAIAEGVAEVLDAPLVRALARSHAPSQRSLAPTERKRNAAKSIRVRGKADLRGWTVILVDDVRTTGATLEAAARALRGRHRGGRTPADRMKIWACALAVVAPQSRRGESQEGFPGADPEG